MTRTMLDFFSPFERLPVASAVNVLRSMHDRNQRGSAAQPSAETTLPDLAPLVGAFTLLHTALGGVELEPHSYEQVCRRFYELQTQLRRQKMAIERLVGHTFAAGDAREPVPPVFQQTLHLQCARGAKTSGRFRFVNRSGRGTQLRVTNDVVLGDKTGRVENAALSIEPSQCPLAAGQVLTMQVTLDLTRCGANPDLHIDAAANVLLDDELSLKLWIAVDLHDTDC